MVDGLRAIPVPVGSIDERQRVCGKLTKEDLQGMHLITHAPHDVWKSESSLMRWPSLKLLPSGAGLVGEEDAAMRAADMHPC